jgi:hypothetical protein
MSGVVALHSNLKSRIATLYLSMTFRDLITLSLHLTRGLVFLNRGQSYV